MLVPLLSVIREPMVIAAAVLFWMTIRSVPLPEVSVLTPPLSMLTALLPTPVVSRMPPLLMARVEMTLLGVKV